MLHGAVRAVESCVLHGAVQTLGLCRIIWCEEYQSAVASICTIPPLPHPHVPSPLYHKALQLQNTHSWQQCVYKEVCVQNTYCTHTTAGMCSIGQSVCRLARGRAAGLCAATAPSGNAITLYVVSVVCIIVLAQLLPFWPCHTFQGLNNPSILE
jgi:hypothetical protein